MELYQILLLGLDDDYGIPYKMYIELIAMISQQSPKLAEEIHAKVRVQDDRAYTQIPYQ